MPSTRAGAATIVSLAIVSAVAVVTFAGTKRPEAAVTAANALPLDAPLPMAIPAGTTLTIGDPTTQHILEHTGWIKSLPFQVKWAEISGGPATTEAFHARVLDVGSAADMPPIHATWVGIPVKIVAVRLRQDPLNHPLYALGVAPTSGIRTLADLRGKRIAFSPGQVQGEVVLRTLKAEGLTAKDVTLVELPSTGGDLYVNALVGGLVDVAPIAAGTQSKRYLDKFADDGARVLAHPPFRDDLTLLYVRQDVLQDPAKAAALRAYIQVWARAAEWERAHPDEWADTYYVKNQGLSPDDAHAVVTAAGQPDIPSDWATAISLEQAAADAMAGQTGHAHLAAASLFDRRFEPLAASAAADQWARETAAAAPHLASASSARSATP
jgi:sulfonate transport system substrate-binding protein